MRIVIGGDTVFAFGQLANLLERVFVIAQFFQQFACSGNIQHGINALITELDEAMFLIGSLLDRIGIDKFFVFTANVFRSIRFFFDLRFRFNYCIVHRNCFFFGSSGFGVLSGVRFLGYFLGVLAGIIFGSAFVLGVLTGIIFGSAFVLGVNRGIAFIAGSGFFGFFFLAKQLFEEVSDFLPKCLFLRFFLISRFLIGCFCGNCG
jgi:hypothetical protein